MAHYLLLIRDNMSEYMKYNTQELTDLISQMGNWSAGLRKAGIHKGAEKLTDDPGKVLRKGAQFTVTDGPYAEAKELVGGFFVIEAKNYDEAVLVAKECPALQQHSSIEIREVADDCNVVLKRANTARD